VISQQKPQWELSPGRHGYHALNIGWYASELVRRVDPQHRRLARFFKEEVLSTLADPSWLKEGTSIPNDFSFGLPADFPKGRVAELHWRFPGAPDTASPTVAATNPHGDKKEETTEALTINEQLKSFHSAFSKLAEDAQSTSIDANADPKTAQKLRRLKVRAGNVIKSSEEIKNPNSNFCRVTTIAKEFTPVNYAQVEVPAAIGFGNATTIAALYSRFADASLVSKDVLQEATTKCSFGPDLVMFGHTTFSKAGFHLPPPDGPEGDPCAGDLPYHPKAFGHPGAGGSLGWGDHELGLGFSFITNTLREEGLDLQSRIARLLDALYECLDETTH